ncbi:MAG: guanylate kinase [Oscillospiraceae bacterium]|nr:guanylate kinase [Ruminococcus sp.]MDD6097136.1 guanylate kinase [Oscillospiraceae bacterium]
MSKGRLIVFSAPSGCGKGTMLREILRDENFYISVSATTREPREGEVDGVDYHFISREEFQNLIDNNGMLEYAEYCDNLYGTPVKEVKEQLDKGRNVILEIEVKGAMKIRKLCPEALFIFVVPPSLKELDRRLRKRGTETEEVIIQRVERAAEEIPYAVKYDYIIVNDGLEEAVEDFRSIVRAESFRAEFARELINEVMKNA